MDNSELKSMPLSVAGGRGMPLSRLQKKIPLGYLNLGGFLLIV